MFLMWKNKTGQAIINFFIEYNSKKDQDDSYFRLQAIHLSFHRITFI